jgi:hypothetical protein
VVVEEGRPYDGQGLNRARGPGWRVAAGARSGAQRKKKEKRKKRGEKRRKRKKDLEELEEVLGKIRREGRRDFCGVFRFFGCWRNFRDGGDGEAGWPVGPQQARDSRRGVRQQRWGGTR